MSTVTIRNFDSTLKAKLPVRAAQNGRSMQAEPRQIVVDSLGREDEPELDLAEAIRRCFAPYGGVDDLVAHPLVPVRDPPTFD